MRLKTLSTILFTIALATLTWEFAPDALAVIQLNDTFKPDGVTDNVLSEVNTEGLSPERATAIVIITTVGKIVSRLLLFTSAAIILFLMTSGARYITAFGKEEVINKGKTGIFWAIIGLLIVMGSYALVQAAIFLILQIDSNA